MTHASPPLSFRIAFESDIAHLAPVDECWRDDGRRLHVEQAVLERRCWLAAAADPATVLGYGLLRHDWMGQPLIELVVVHPEHRGRGIGRAILRHLISTAAGDERQVFAATNRSNTSMQRALDAEGFVSSGVINHLDAGDPELVYMRPPGTAGATTGAALQTR